MEKKMEAILFYYPHVHFTWSTIYVPHFKLSVFFKVLMDSVRKWNTISATGIRSQRELKLTSDIHLSNILNGLLLHLHCAIEKVFINETE